MIGAGKLVGAGQAGAGQAQILKLCAKIRLIVSTLFCLRSTSIVYTSFTVHRSITTV